MRRLFTMLLILISALAMYMIISSHKAREPDYRPVNLYFSSEGKYFTFDHYH